MAIETSPSKKFLSKTVVKMKKKLPGGGKIKVKKTFTHPRTSSPGPGSIRTGQNPMPSRLNADIGFDY